MNENFHHILYQRRRWRDRPDSAQLRETDGLIVPMDVDIHQELHDHLWEGVPLLGRQAVLDVMYEMDRNTTYLEIIDNVLSLIEKTRDPMADLAIYAIESQLPFIREGITQDNVVTKRQRRARRNRNAKLVQSTNHSYKDV